MKRWNVVEDRIDNVFQEGILDRVRSRAGRVATHFGNAAKGTLGGRQEDLTVVDSEQVKKYMLSKYNEMANDLNKLLKDGSNKSELEKHFNSELSDAFNVFIKRAEEIYKTAHTPPPLPTDETAEQSPTQQSPYRTAPTNMGV